MKIKQKLFALLKWSEKYTKTDMVYLASGGFWLSLANVISLLGSFFSSIAFANFLSVNDYGIYRYILSTVNILTIPALSGMNSAITRAIAKDFDGTFFLGLKTKFKWSLFGSLAGLVMGGYYYFNHNFVLAISLFIAAAFLPFMETAFLYIALLQGKKLFKQNTAYNIINRIGTTLILIAVTFLARNVIIIILTYFICNTSFRLLALSWSLKKNRLNEKVDVATIPYGKHLSFMGILGQLSVYLDPILIFTGIGAPVLAGYYLSLIPFKQTQSVLNSINILALPKLSQNNNAEIKKTLPQKVLKSYALIVPIILLYYFTAPYIFKFIYPKYLDWVDISRIFMVILLVYPLTLFSTALTAMGEKKKLYAISLFYAILRIILLLITIPLFGIDGAVFSIITTTVLSNLLVVILFYLD